jgi:hypothetical protein
MLTHCIFSCSENEYNIRNLAKKYFREEPMQYIFHSKTEFQRKLPQIKYTSGAGIA